ncbi:MAG: glycosyltransferase family 2 protein [Haloplanus sp.]
MSPSASVIVPAYREPERVSDCLDSLSGQDAEVVVVAGDDETRAAAADHATCDRVVVDEGAGAGAARNRGVDDATGEVVLFTDADTTVPPDWVSKHRRHYEATDVVGVGGPARPLDGDTKDDVLFKLLSDYWYRVSWPVGFVQLPTFNCSYRASTFREHGGFDEEIPFMEDTELSLRLRDAGRFVYDPSTCVATSVRRERDEGYLSLFLTYARAYVSYYVLDREFDGEYFESQ